jgi:hypothetical protein
LLFGLGAAGAGYVVHALPLGREEWLKLYPVYHKDSELVSINGLNTNSDTKQSIIPLCSSFVLESSADDRQILSNKAQPTPFIGYFRIAF